MSPAAEREVNLLAAKLLRDAARVQAMRDAKEAAREKRKEKREQ